MNFRIAPLVSSLAFRLKAIAQQQPVDVTKTGAWEELVNSSSHRKAAFFPIPVMWVEQQWVVNNDALK